MEEQLESANPIRVIRKVVLSQDDLEMTLSCPVTHCIFHTPVILIGSGYTVEKEIALQLLQSGKSLCPITQKPFTAFEVNRGMLDMVCLYLEKYPDARADQYKPVGTTDDAQAASNNNQDLGAQAFELPVPPAQEPLAAPDPAHAVGDGQNRGVQLQALLRHRAEIRPDSDIYRLPVAVMITPAPAQRVDMLADEEMYMKVVCVGNEPEQKSRFIFSLTDVYSKNFISTMCVDFNIVKHGDSNFRIWNTAGQERFRTITSSYYKDAHFILIFANEALEGLDICLEDCRRYMNGAPQLYWINGTAAAGHRLVACQEPPLESIERSRFPVLSKSNYVQSGFELLDEAKALVLRNVDVNLVEPVAPQHPPAGGNCSVM